MFKFFFKKKTTIEIEMVELKLTIDNNFEPERLLEFIQRETKSLVKHTGNIGKRNSDSHDYSTPELLIASVLERFGTFKSILTFLMSVLQNQLKNVKNNNESFNLFIITLNNHRDKINSAVDQLRKQNHQVSELYEPVLLLRSVTWPLLELMKNNPFITEVLPRSNRKDPKSSDVLIEYLREIYYLPRITYSTLEGMELSQQRSDQNYQIPSNSY